MLALMSYSSCFHSACKSQQQPTQIAVIVLQVKWQLYTCSTASERPLQQHTLSTAGT